MACDSFPWQRRVLRIENTPALYGEKEATRGVVINSASPRSALTKTFICYRPLVSFELLADDTLPEARVCARLTILVRAECP